MASSDSTFLNAQQLRQIFDRRFAMPAEDTDADTVEFLGIRINSKPYAIHIQHLVRLESIRKIVSLPGVSPDQCGLAGIQGRLVAVFRLASLLNLNPKLEHDQWIAVCNLEHPIGFSFHSVDGLLQFSSRDMIHHTAATNTVFLKTTITTNDAHRPVIDVVEIVKSILHESN